MCFSWQEKGLGRIGPVPEEPRIAPPFLREKQQKVTAREARQVEKGGEDRNARTDQVDPGLDLQPAKDDGGNCCHGSELCLRTIARE